MTCQRAAAEFNWAEEEDGGGWLVCATIGGTWDWGEWIRLHLGVTAAVLFVHQCFCKGAPSQELHLLVEDACEAPIVDHHHHHLHHLALLTLFQSPSP